MQLHVLLGTVILLSFGIFPKVLSGQVVEPHYPDKQQCDFSKYERLIQPQALYRGAVKKVDPEYPAAGKNMKVEGKVIVRILVNKKGDVISSCIIEGHPLLRAASIVAANKWKFKKNFGFINSKPKPSYAETDLTFNFYLP